MRGSGLRRPSELRGGETVISVDVLLHMMATHSACWQCRLVAAVSLHTLPSLDTSSQRDGQARMHARQPEREPQLYAVCDYP